MTTGPRPWRRRSGPVATGSTYPVQPAVRQFQQARNDGRMRDHYTPVGDGDMPAAERVLPVVIGEFAVEGGIDVTADLGQQALGHLGRRELRDGGLTRRTA